MVKLMLRFNFEKKLKIKSLVAWSTSEGRVDQKQIINFVWPYYYYQFYQKEGMHKRQSLYKVLARKLSKYSTQYKNNTHIVTLE